MSSPKFDKDYTRKKLKLVLRDLNVYTADEFWREINRITSGATGLPSAEELAPRAKELEAENAELRKFIEAKMHHLPIEDQHVASVMIQQSDDEGEA